MTKKGKKGAGDPADGPDVDAGAKAIAEVMSLRTQLGMRQTALTDAETAKRQAEEKLAKLRADFDQEQETAYEISKDMTRTVQGHAGTISGAHHAAVEHGAGPAR